MSAVGAGLPNSTRFPPAGALPSGRSPAGLHCAAIDTQGRENDIMDYADYQHLRFEPKPNGVLLITLNRPEVLNATNGRMHWELTQMWLTVDADPHVRVALVTGAGSAFSAGG